MSMSSLPHIFALVRCPKAPVVLSTGGLTTSAFSGCLPYLYLLQNLTSYFDLLKFQLVMFYGASCLFCYTLGGGVRRYSPKAPPKDYQINPPPLPLLLPSLFRITFLIDF